MRKKLLLLPLIAACIYVTLCSYSEGPAITASINGTGSTGSAGCSCHNPSSTAATVVSIQLYDATGTTLITGGYVGGTAYKIKLTGSQTNVSLVSFGFQLAVVKASGAGTGSAVNAGTMSAAPSGTHLYTLSGINIFEHYNGGAYAAVAGTLSGSVENYAETITWTAPSAGTGTVIAYGTINAVNGDHSAGSPDAWNNTTLTIPEVVTVAPITGTATVCVNAVTPLSDITAAGTWTSSNTNIATVIPSGAGNGHVSGVSAGGATITYNTSAGFAVAPVTVNPLPDAGTISGAVSVCAGSAIHLTDATTGGVWTSSNTSFATVTGTGTVNAISGGSVNISYSVTNSCGTAVITQPVTINPLPVSGTISGSATVCAGSITHLTDATTGGVWSGTNTSFATVTATGDVTGVAAGSATISYSVTNGCGTTAATQLVTVNPLPNAGTISGAITVCAGAAIHLTDATTGGAWTSSNTSFATVTASGAGTGTINGLSGGSVNISYSVTNGCGTAVATQSVTVDPLPISGTISGPATVCAGSITHLTDATTGGVWSSTNTSFDAVTNTGDVTGVAAGSATISYTVTNGCGTVAATQVVTVNPLPAAGTISGPPTVCAGSVIHLTDGTAGGAWSSTNTSFATVTATGDVTAVSAGSATISYTATNGCGTIAATQPITINPLPDAGTISGTPSVCANATIPLTDAAAGGIWSSSNSSLATVTSAGVVSGVSNGSAAISYTVTNGCGAAVVSLPFTINPLPVSGTITGGASIVCAGSVVSFSDASPGGVWSSSNTSFATVNNGTVDGISQGVVNVSYVVTNGCGTSTTSTPLTVNPLPVAGSISGGASVVCVGSSVIFSDAASGGVWSSSNTSFATVSSGTAGGVSPGSVNISYSVTNSCGTAITSVPLTINPLPAAGTITGGSSVCVNAIIPLSDAAGIGSWSSGNTSLATVTATGVVSGVAQGSVNISYSVTNSCGTAVTSAPVIVLPLPAAGTITNGASSICQSAVTIFSDAVSGGAWSSSNTSIATVTPGGGVSGVSSGGANISYSTTNTCGTAITSVPLTVNPSPNAGSITGGSSVICTGAQTTFSDAVPGGAWSNNNTSVATVSAGGVVSGLTVGVTTVSYSVTNSCGTAVANTVVGVTLVANAGSITGSSTVCPGSTIHLSDGVAGGIWSSTNTSVATISASGIVTGITAGSTTISYAVSGSCGVASTSIVITVDPSPSVGAVSGLSSVCQGASLPLSDGTAAGVWSSSNTSQATINSSGIVMGVAGGSPIISYTYTNSCGSATTTYPITINSLPSAGVITGNSVVCVGSSTYLSDAIAGGVWSSTTTTVATVDASGITWGAASGSSVLSYTFSNLCGPASATYTVTAEVPLSAGTIIGPSSVCAGTTIHLSDAVFGGVWSSSSTSFATVTVSGVVSGVAGGTANISYSVNNSCGIVATSTLVGIDPLPVAGVIIGSPSVCVSSVIHLSDAAAGGVWSSSNTSFATVSSTGDVSGTSAGALSISYSVTNGCGTAVTSTPVTVDPLPAAGVITGSSSVCAGTTIHLSDIVTGGVWSSSNTLASVIPGGTVNGISAGNSIISYSVTTGCGTAIASMTVTVNPQPVAGTITGGAAAVCVGSSIIFSDVAVGGIWSSSNASFATVSSGIAGGVSPGSVSISYSVTNGCGTVVASTPVVVNPLPASGTISGPSSVCAGTAVHLSDGIASGVWSSSNTTFATVTNTGMISGVSAGNTNISYSVTNSCGTAITTTTVTTNPQPDAGTITGGASAICAGSGTALSDAVAGGVWSSSNNSFATVSAGIVDGVSAGSVAISYSVTNGCGTAVTSVPVIINPLPAAGTITGPSSVCVSAGIHLSDTSSSGVWSSSNTNLADVSPSGLVSGISQGVVDVSYTVTNICGSAIASFSVSVNPLPIADIITGQSSVCAGNVTDLTDATTGGVWSSSNSLLATVVGGIVSGISTGNLLISYSVSNSCGIAVSTASVMVLPQPVAGTITGLNSSVCAGSTIVFTDPSIGGVWNSSDGSIATVSSGGAVGGVSTGAILVSYTVTNSCGSAVATTSVTVNSLPATGTITGGNSVCQGNTIILSDPTATGVWSSSNTNGFVSFSGTFIALSPGLDTVYYTVTDLCGSAHASLQIRVIDLSLCAAGVKYIPDDEGINIYPNPSNGSFDIDFQKIISGANIIIMDISGRVIETSTATDPVEKIHINLGGVAKGSYIVKISTPDRIYRQKIVIW